MAFKIFSKFCFLTALLVRKIGNHQMVVTTPKIPTIKLFTPISLMAFCRYSFITFEAASSVAPAMTIKGRRELEKWLVLALQAKFASL